MENIPELLRTVRSQKERLRQVRNSAWQAGAWKEKATLDDLCLSLAKTERRLIEAMTSDIPVVRLSRMGFADRRA